MLSKLPIFQIADKTLMQLQTKWAQILNPIINLANSFNSTPPTQQILTTGTSGIYKTPTGVFYLNVTIYSPSGSFSTFGVNYLQADNNSAVIPNNSNVRAFFYHDANSLNAIIANPEPSYPYSVAGGTAFIAVREYYQ